MRSKVPDSISVFILPPSRDALVTRMRNRGQDSEAVIQRRLAAAREEMAHFDEFNYVIVNENFDAAAAELRAIFVAHRLRLAAQKTRNTDLIAQLLSADPLSANPG